MKASRNLATLAIVSGVFCLELAIADDYPNRPVTIVVGFGVGGSADRMTRSGIDKLITQPWSIRPQNAFHAVAQFQDENARDRKNR